MPSRPTLTKVGVASLAVSASLVTTLGLSSLPADAMPAASTSPARPVPLAKANRDLPTAKLAGGLDRGSKGRHSVFVQLRGRGAAAVAQRSSGSARTAKDAARTRRADVARTADSVLATARAEDNGAARLWQVSNAVPGVAVRADSAALTAIAARADVVKVSPLVPKTVSNAGAAQLTKVLHAWHSYGTGAGVTVGVIDTGLDYTHSDFGGVGTKEAYTAALADSTNPDWRSTLPELGKAKVAGGYDFVGNDYNADPAASDYQPVPNPDADPIDCGEHGTHVAGTAAGYGVNSDGSTFTGDYSSLTGSDLYTMKVGPGMAPKAQLYSLKVFGCSGSTDAVIPALDWALDPNGDGDFSDHLDIINLSLGSDYGTVDDPENKVINTVARNGVLPVIAMGNNGDLTDTGGAPGNAVRSLAVASSVDPYQLRDGLKVNAPSDVSGIASGQVSSSYPWSSAAPVNGDVAAIPGSDADGCTPLSSSDAAKVAGKVAWLEWDDNDSTRRCGSAVRSGNVEAAGAIGAVFTSSLNVFGAGIAGNATLPVFQLPKTETDRLRPAAEAGTLNVTFDGSLVGTIRSVTPSITDTLSSFSSRGPHGSIGVVKPDVTAPGDTITSALMGSGSDQLTISGTSMATPHTAGIAALVEAQHPAWRVEQVKAAIMNTAGHDLWTGEGHTGNRYGPARVGAGRVDALGAVSTNVIAYTTNTRGAVSASFGVVPARITKRTVTRTRTLEVQNTGAARTTVALRYQGVVSQPGVSYSVSPSSLTLKGHSSRTATVTMTVRPRSLRHTIDPTMDKLQLDAPRQFVPDASGRVLVRPSDQPALRVPVYGAAKPASQTSASVKGRRIVLRGTGVLQGKGRTAYRSATSVLELGATSPALTSCRAGKVGGCYYNKTSKAGDLQYVGAGATKDYLWFGIATRSDWANIGNVLTPYVDYDVTGDGTPDLETYVANFPSSDILLAVTVDYSTGAVVDQEPVNLSFGDRDTNVFDTNVITLPVEKDLILDAGAAHAPISYKVGTFDGVTGTNVDTSRTVAFDADAPKVSTGAPLWFDLPSSIPFKGKAGAKALVLHLHGLPGKRAQVLKVK